MAERFGVRTGKSGVLKWSAVAVIVLIAVAGAFYIDTHSREVGHQIALATSRQPEPFTELYFADASALPASAKTGQTIPVHFVIKNLEQKPTDYKYAVSFTDAAGTTELRVAEVRVEPDEAKTINYDVVVPQGEGRGKIGVQLTDKNQSVHFWIERT